MRGLGALAALVILAAAACSSPQSTQPATVSQNLSAPTPLLKTAIAQAAPLGRAGAATHVDLSPGLNARSPERLAYVVPSCPTVHPHPTATQIGPHPDVGP